MNKDRYYVGIGASAGGLESLQNFFKNVDSNSGLVYIVIQHLSPDYKSMMKELLARYTKMDIHVAEDGMMTEKDNIYLIPPRSNLSIYNGKLFLEDQKKDSGINLPINIFFRSLAKDKGDRSIGVILSGTGSDGTLGIKAIKESGGLVIVEDTTSAKFDGMPRSSINTGIVDHVLIADEMPNKIEQYIKYPNENGILDFDSEKSLTYLSKIFMTIRNYKNIDFSKYKESTMYRRINRRMIITKNNSIANYVDYLRNSNEEKEILFKELLIGVTTFYRNPEAFKALTYEVFPKFDYSKDEIRIWSAGCSTGEEAYSIVMHLNEYIEENNFKVDIKCFATDIDEEALEIAGIGFYNESSLSDLDNRLRAKYFIKKEGGYQINESIRKKIVFAKHNIINDPPFSKLDLISCRNLFIYLKSKEQQKLLSSFHHSLKDSGFLFLGNSESLGKISESFEVINSRWKIYKFKEDFNLNSDNNLHVTKYRNNIKTDHQINEYKTQNSFWLENLLVKALEKTTGASILIDNNDNILEILGDTSKFISFQPGRFSNKISSNIPKNLALYVNNIIRRLNKNNHELILKNITPKDTLADKITITGRLINLNNLNYYLISFSEEDINSENDIHEIEMSAGEQDRIEELEFELHQAREGLQATVEELETSNEELQSSNEELVAANEELQSTNEELQSVNEELYTVNNEYEEKINELVKANNDLKNIALNTNVGALYLDKDLKIRRVTDIFMEQSKVIQNDIGRSIEDLKIFNDYENIYSDVKKVMNNLTGISKNIEMDNGEVWKIKIMPFRKDNNVINGSIITISNITELNNKNKANICLNEQLFSILSSNNIGWWGFEKRDQKFSHSDNFLDLINNEKEKKLDFEEFRNLIHKEDISIFEKELNSLLESEKERFNLEIRIISNEGKYQKYHVFCEDNKHETFSDYNLYGTISSLE